MLFSLKNFKKLNIGLLWLSVNKHKNCNIYVFKKLLISVQVGKLKIWYTFYCETSEKILSFKHSFSSSCSPCWIRTSVPLKNKEDSGELVCRTFPVQSMPVFYRAQLFIKLMQIAKAKNLGSCKLVLLQCIFRRALFIDDFNLRVPQYHN